MKSCQFEPVGLAKLSESCQQSGEYRVQYRFAGDVAYTPSLRRYCRTHAIRYRDYLIRAGIDAMVVPA